MKTRSKAFLILISILAILLILLGSFIYKTNYRKTEISTYEKDRYQLVIYQIGTPTFPFGSGKCQIVLYKDGKQISKEDIELKNDGKWPDTGNFSVKWNFDSVTVNAHGEEQEDMIYTLSFN